MIFKLNRLQDWAAADWP